MVTEKYNLIVIKKTILEDSKDDFVTFSVSCFYRNYLCTANTGFHSGRNRLQTESGKLSVSILGWVATLSPS